MSDEKKDTSESAEDQLFSWEDWDQHGTACFGFNNPVLNVTIGEFEKGTAFEYATVDYETARLFLMDDENREHVFPLLLSVGPKLQVITNETEDE